MAKTRTAQQNAISYSITKRNNKRALEWLSNVGIDYDMYCRWYGWKASPVRLKAKIEPMLEELYREMGINVDWESIYNDFACDYNTFCHSYKKNVGYFYYIDEFHVMAIDTNGVIYRGDEVEDEL